MRWAGLALGVVIIAFLSPASAAILPGGIPGLTSGPWGAWRWAPADVGWVSPFGPTEVAVAPDGDVHVTYSAVPPSGLFGDSAYYAKRSEGLWSTQFLSGPGSGGGVAVDSSGAAHVAFEDFRWELGSKMKYVKDPGVGVVEEFDDVFAHIYDSTLQLDADERPHVFYVTSQKQVRHAWRDASGWNVEVVDTAGVWTIDAKIAPSGAMHVAFGENADQNHLRYAVKPSGGSWSVERVPGCHGVNNAIGLALDSLERPHIACRSRAGAGFPGLGFMHIWHDGSVWQQEVLDLGPLGLAGSRENRGRYVDIAIDAQDRIHVSHARLLNPFNQDFPTERVTLDYGVKVGNSWSWERVDGVGSDVGNENSITLDSQGRPHVVAVMWQRADTLCSADLPACGDLDHWEPASAALGVIDE